jgi:hypothetical protein
MGLRVLFGFSTGGLVLSDTLAGNLLVSLIGNFFNNPDIQNSLSWMVFTVIMT